MVSKKIIKVGKVNSAVDSRYDIALKALPLRLLKYLDIVVDAVCDINPWPENLIRKIAKNKYIKLLIKEKLKLATDNKTTTIKEYLKILISSIFFPNQTKSKLENIVAIAYTEPNSPWDMPNSLLILELKSPKKKLCPKLEKNVNMNPKIITFKLKLLNII